MNENYILFHLDLRKRLQILSNMIYRNDELISHSEKKVLLKGESM